MFSILTACLIFCMVCFGSLFSMSRSEKVLPEIRLSFKATNATQIHFSPNFDGARDFIMLELGAPDIPDIASWELSVLNSSRNLEYHVGGSIDQNNPKIPNFVQWDGSTDSGGIAAEGQYYLVFKITLKDKTEIYSKTNVAVIDVTQPTASFKLYDNILSPDGDGNKDTLKIRQNLSASDFWKAEIRSFEGKVIREWDFGNKSPDEVIWDGKNGLGQTVEDGEYDYIVYGKDMAGNLHTALVSGIRVNTVKSFVDLEMVSNKISPNGDGVCDIITIKPIIEVKKDIQKLELVIQNRQGETVRTIGSKRIPPVIYWDGTDDKGNIVKDGLYYCRLSVLYRSGNKPVSSKYPLLVDTTAPKPKWEILPTLFIPDGDGIDDVVSIFLDFEDLSEIKNWKLTFYDPYSQPFMSFEGNGHPETFLYWNGLSSKGEIVESLKWYPVKISVSDVLGNSLEDYAMGFVKVGKIGKK